MLNELDKELEARGLQFTRYAHDCVIAVKSESSAKSVMRTVTDWIQRKLGLKVNMTKTHITRPQKLKYLGFGFYKDSKANEWKCRPHQDSVKKYLSAGAQPVCLYSKHVCLVPLAANLSARRSNAIKPYAFSRRQGFGKSSLARRSFCVQAYCPQSKALRHGL